MYLIMIHTYSGNIWRDTQKVAYILPYQYGLAGAWSGGAVRAAASELKTAPSAGYKKVLSV